MATYYLRVEGVNLSNFVSDTQELSTVRGGSLMLLHAIDTVQHGVRSAELTPLSVGASSGIFRFDVGSPDRAESIRREAEDLLRGPLWGVTSTRSEREYSLKHATFVVDLRLASLQEEEGFVMDREALLARNRWGQMCQPSLSIPAQNRKRALHCPIDLVRPGTEDMFTPEGDRVKISASVETRRQYGLAQKFHFYRVQTELDFLQDNFARHFEELTHGHDRGNLHHKMALIYVDGNGFGMLQDERCTTPSLQARFDQTVRGYRKTLLRALFEERITPESDGWTNPGTGNYQIETLLWGGDEIVLVVPAWQGWNTLQFFFEHTRQNTWSFEGVPLTHKAGLVFCHHSAPIGRVQGLAKELARLAKKKIGETGHEDVFAYQTLESFDHVGRGVEGFRAERIPWDGDPNQLILAGEHMAPIKANMAALKQSFPRTKLHQIVNELVKKQDPSRRERDLAMAANIVNTLRLDEPALAAVSALTEHLGGENTRWFHLADLWDYVGV